MTELVVHSPENLGYGTADRASDDRRPRTIVAMSEPKVIPLEGVERHYAWGSTTAIPDLLGREPDGTPVAELWFGTHPDAPAGVPGQDDTLADLIAADPERTVGPAVLEDFGPHLPFLVKILAAESPLSIQVHPTREQARAGFDAEEAAGVARDAAERTYKDANHKPELLCALDTFEALCGFRPVDETLAALDQLDVPQLGFLSDLLRGPDPLRAAMAELLAIDDPAPLVDEVARAAGSLGRHAELARVVELTSTAFPGDVGVLVALLLNYVRLAPGEAIYLPAGNVHAYLRGTGIEVMAASDNVLRCGLTPKHIDRDAVLQVADFHELPDPRWPAEHGVFAVPVPDFRLVPFPVGEQPISLGGAEPWIVLCSEGEVTVDAVRLRPGEAAFVPVAAQPVTVAGTGPGRRGQVFAAAAAVA